MLKVGIVLASLALVVNPVRALAAPRVCQDVAFNLAVLTASSRLVADHTENPDFIAYAASEAAAQSGFAPSAGSSVDIAAADRNDLQTGRSAAVAGVPSTGGQRDIATATAGLATLNSLKGSAFEKLFVILQRDALRQIQTDYRICMGQGSNADTETRDRLAEIAARLGKLPAI